VRRLGAIVLVLALGVAVVGATAVPAGGKIANSKVSIGIGFVSGNGDPFFRGQVKSGRTSCLRNRPVGIWFQRNHGKMRFFRRGRADASGYYQVDMNATMRTGGYFARVKPKQGCKEDTSNTVAVGQNGPGGIG
jgi:hypothetical protein